MDSGGPRGCAVNRAELIAAVKAGQDARQRRMLNSMHPAPNPYRKGSLKAEAFECGYANDLHRWLEIFNGRRVATGKGRFKAHETIQLERPGSNAEKATFCSYQGDGLARVISSRFGFETVPVKWLAHRRAEVPA